MTKPHRSFRSMGAAVAVLALAFGCYKPTYSTHRPTDEDDVFGRYDRIMPSGQMGRDKPSVELSVQWIRVSNPEGLGSIDGSILSPARRATYAANGLQLGLASEEFARQILALPGEARTREAVTPRPGTHAYVGVGPGLPRKVSLEVWNTGATVRTVEATNPTLTLAVSVEGDPGGIVRMHLRPELRHDQRTNTDLLRDLSAEVSIPSGQSIVLRGIPSEGSTIGNLFFLSDEAGKPAQTFLVVKATLR